MRSLIGRLAVLLLCASALLWTPSDLAAQACLGSPTHPGQTGLDLRLSAVDGATGYGAGVNTRLAGPVSLGADVTTFDIDNIDKNMNRYEFRTAYELPLSNLSVCPAVGLRYSTFGIGDSDLNFDISQFMVPLGFGIGKRFELEDGLVLIPSAMANLLYIREKASATAGSDSVSITETGARVGGIVGATLGFSRFYGRGEVSFDTIKDSDSIVSISFGVVF